MDRYNISFAGAGRVAGALCRKMYQAGHKIELIVSPTPERGKSLAQACRAEWSDVPDYPSSTDVIIISVPDHSLKTVLEHLHYSQNTVILHTAGSYGLEVFPAEAKHCGIFYPFQTFSSGRDIDFVDLPFLIEFSDHFTYEIITGLASSTGSKIFQADSGKRRMLHIAGVFACNFVNHLFTQGKSIAEAAGFPFKILEPLIKETVSKALILGPENSQTGPASRGDMNTISKHIDILEYNPSLLQIYRDLTHSILNFYNIPESGKF